MSDLREALRAKIIYSLQCSRIGVNVPDEQVADMVLTGLDDERRGWDSAHPAPARVEITDEMRAASLKALHDDPNWHKPSYDGGGWRANYGMAVDLVLAAAVPFLQPQPVDRPLLDREAVGTAIAENVWPTADGTVEIIEAIPAVMELARPMPTREQIREVIEETEIPDCGKVREFVDPVDIDAIADSLAALLGGVDESGCTCGFGGFHEERNPNCDRNRVDESGKS